MDDNLFAFAQSIIQKSKPENEIARADIIDIAKCHKFCLPHTTSSRSGIDVLTLLYETLIDDPYSLVLWRRGDMKNESHLGAFVSATVNLQRTESLIKRSLKLSLLLKLSFFNALNPSHIMAGYIWKKIVPSQGIGYILTIGVTEEAKKQNSFISGKNLIYLVEQWFRNMGIKESWVDTEMKNHRAIAFYHELGYIEVHKTCGQILLKKVFDE